MSERLQIIDAQALMRDLPVISVIMPVRNSVRTIRKAIESVLSQNYPKTQFMILDGGSTDGTVDVIRQYADQLYDWCSAPDAGAYAAINTGIQKATGDLVAQLMADDWYEPGIFQVVGEAFVAHPEADIFSCGGRIVEFDKKTQNYKVQQIYETADSVALTLPNICHAVSAIGCRFIRKSLFERTGLYDFRNAANETILSADKALLLKAVFLGARDYFVGCAGHVYLAHPASSTFAGNRKNAIRLCAEHMEMALTLPRQFNLAAGQEAFLRDWYRFDAAKLFLFYLLEGKIRAAFRVAQTAVNEAGIRWLLTLVRVPFSIMQKKIRKFFSYQKNKKDT